MTERVESVDVCKLTVARTARYAVCGAAPAEAERLWIVFHGYGMRAADFLALFAGVVPAGTRIIAPEGLSRFYVKPPVPDGSHLRQTGATWLTRDDREDELRDALAMLQSVVAREHAAILADRSSGAPRVGVLGFSQGVAMSMRWVVIADQNPSLRNAAGPSPAIHAHVLWAGGLAHDVPDAELHRAWEHTALDLVVGDRDAYATDASRAAILTRLSAIGVSANAHRFPGGHRLHTPLLARLLDQL